MKVIQATIHSDLRKADQIYQASDEVEQELTIQENGIVTLHAASHEGLPCWQEEKEIEKEICQTILRMLDRSRPASVVTPSSVGQWRMELIYENGSQTTASGPMIGHVAVDGIDLTRYIREHMPFMSLGVFDTTDSL